MAPGPLRIAVLECDNPLPQTKARFGGYGGVFEFLLKRGARALGPDVLDPERDLKVTKWHVEGDDDGVGAVDGSGGAEYPDLEDIDAILLTGSRHNSFDSSPWIKTLVEFTRKALAHPRVRVIGVCFGHQIVGRAMDGDAAVGRNEQGWEAAVNEVQLTSKGKELFGGKDVLSIHQMHRDIVYHYPEGVEELGSSPVCKVQGMYKKGKLITVQGHPEFSQPIMEEILTVRHSTGIFDDASYEKYSKRVADSHDGVVVGMAFLRFLMAE